MFVCFTNVLEYLEYKNTRRYMRLKAQKSKILLSYVVTVSTILPYKWIYLLLLIKSAKACIPGTLVSGQCAIFNVF